MHGNMNELTKKLLEEGCSKDNHPDYVKWYANMNEFEYTTEFLNNSVWEAPCGVIRKGYFTSGYLSYAGVQWRVENNNYNFHCPYRKKECEFHHPFLKELNIGSKCSWHLSDKLYDYNNSVEKIEHERDELILDNLYKKFGVRGMINCMCCHINYDTCQPYLKYEPCNCIQYTQNGCFNKTCWITKKERDLTLANIYYDVKTTSEYKKGFITEPVIVITKGIKFFDNRKPITDLEMFLKVYPNKIYEKEESRHRSQFFRARYHGEKFELEVLNIRIEKRESRDLLQDLQDIKEGITVIHKSDSIKKEKEEKRERKTKYQESKIRRKNKKQFDLLDKSKIEIKEQLNIEDLIGGN